MFRLLAVATVLCGISSAIGDAHEPTHEPNPGQQAHASGAAQAFRLVVADAKAATIKIIDLGNGELLGSLPLATPARLHAGSSGRYAYAVQPEANEVAVIDSGIAVESHGDHADIKVFAPQLLPLRLRGPGPSHLTHDNARVAVFFDGDGTAQIFSEQEFAKGGMGHIQRVETGAGHHGVAFPIARHLAVTIRPEGEGLPDTIELRRDDAPERQRIGCARLHGEAATGRFVAFGCADGVAIFEAARNGVVSRQLTYPASLPPGRMIRRMTGATGFTFFAADFGADGMVIFDPSAADGDFRFIALPARRMDFNLHPESGDRLFVIVEDGTLLSINPLTGATEAQVRATDRYAMDQSTVRPRIASVGPYVAVSDPRKGEVLILDATTLTPRQRIKVGGAPSDLLAIGGDGVAH
jgi:hypothetical protein